MIIIKFELHSLNCVNDSLNFMAIRCWCLESDFLSPSTELASGNLRLRVFLHLKVYRLLLTRMKGDDHCLKLKKLNRLKLKIIGRNSVFLFY